jgi:hypothetical protein
MEWNKRSKKGKKGKNSKNVFALFTLLAFFASLFYFGGTLCSAQRLQRWLS